MLREYAVILLSLIISVSIALLLFIAPYAIAPRNYDFEKLSVYECGFEPFQDSRGSVDVRFYLVAMLFIIFDLEVIFLFPWATIAMTTNPWNYWGMIVFVLYLTLGFVYEWEKGALDWS